MINQDGNYYVDDSFYLDQFEANASLKRELNELYYQFSSDKLESQVDSDLLEIRNIIENPNKDIITTKNY